MACKGVVFATELGTALTLKEKADIRQQIENAGATISPVVGKSVRVMIASAEETSRRGYKIAACLSLDIPIYGPEELDHILRYPEDYIKPLGETPIVTSTSTPAVASATQAEQSLTPVACVEAPHSHLAESVTYVDSSDLENIFGSFFGSDEDESAFGLTPKAATKSIPSFAAVKSQPVATVPLTTKAQLSSMKSQANSTSPFSASARASKFQSIMSKTVAPLSTEMKVTPIVIRPIVVTPLSIANPPVFKSSYFGSNSKPIQSEIADPPAIVFETLADFSLGYAKEKEEQSSNAFYEQFSCRSNSSSTIADNEEVSTVAISSLISNGETTAPTSFVLSQQEEDSFNQWYIGAESASQSSFESEAPEILPAPAPQVPAPPRKKQPRVYFDPVSGQFWKKKPKNIASISMSLDDPSRVRTEAPAPRKARSSPTVRGTVIPGVSWVDIVLGNVTTTKLVPAMDGKKIFVSGISFKDIEEKGHTREAQLPKYKAEYLKKEKERNESSLKKLKKKAKKAAEANCSVDAEGNTVDPGAQKKAVDSIKSTKVIRKMKTDEQLLVEIEVWNEGMVQKAKSERVELYQAIFARFGSIMNFDPHWKEGYLFVTYYHEVSAQNAIKSLTDFDIRASVVRQLKRSFPKFAAESLPSPSFYVRWPECYQRKLDRKKNKAEEAKRANQAAAVARRLEKVAKASKAANAKVLAH